VTGELVTFVDHGMTQQAGNDGGARITASVDAARTGLGDLAPAGLTGRLFIGVFAGSQRTGGYTVRAQTVERTGDRLIVHARFVSPSPGALTIQVITSPAQLISIPAANAANLREAVLVDDSGAERARTTVTVGGP
jgi:PrcB C-terminal